MHIETLLNELFAVSEQLPVSKEAQDALAHYANDVVFLSAGLWEQDDLQTEAEHLYEDCCTKEQVATIAEVAMRLLHDNKSDLLDHDWSRIHHVLATARSLSV